MPSTATVRHTRRPRDAPQRRSTSENESSASDDEESVRAGKRPRISNESEVASGIVEPRPVVKVMAERDPKDGYIPGSILKVELTNFVTYDSVSFTPGPHLNMIIGPNGTGKSTISCAICLGLGWPPALLGRATKISAFVKHGAEHGSITITMKNKAGKEPLTIRRTIHSANDGSQWSLNGKQTTLTAIQDQVEKLNVQVSNLCTFLPQDRVCEFAAMTPQQLLVETQRCAGNENLPEWHEQLIEDAKKEKTLREEVEKHEKDLGREEEANKRIENEVAKFEEREKLEKELRYSNLLLPFAKYQQQKEEADKLKKEKEKLAGQLSALRDRFKPFDVQCAQLQEGVRRKKASVVKANDNVTKLVASYSRTKDALSKVDDDLGKVRSDLETVKKNEEEAQNQIRKLQKEIRALEKVVEKVPDRPDTTTFKSRVDPLERQLNALRQEVKQLDEEKAQWSDSREKARRDISHAENQLARLQDARQQRDHQCQLADQTLWKAVCWIRENKDRFKGALPQPLRLAVSIKDRYKNNSRIVTLAESVFSHANLRTFVCTERDDYILLTEELNKKQRLRVNLAELPQTRGELSSRVPTEQLSQYGLDAYVSDLLDAPEEVMVYLKLTQNLHNLPVAFKPSQEVNGDLVNPRIFRSYLTYDSAFSFSKSKYGAGNMTTTAKTIQSSRDSWMRTTDNEDLRREWEQTRAHHVNLKDEATKKLEAATAQKDELNSQMGPLKEEINEINEEKKRVTQAWNDWNKANNELAGKNKHLVKVTDRPKEEDEQKRHTKKLLSICENRRKMALEAKVSKRVLFSIVDATAEAQILSLELLQAEANAAHLQGQIDEKREILLMKEQEYEHSRTAHKSLTTECKMLFATAQQAMDGVEEELKTKFRQAHMEEDRQPVPKVDEIEELIQAQRTQLDMTEEVSQDIRDQYNTRKAKIIHLRRQVEASSARLHNISRAVQEIRDQWYPALQSLIKGISKKFDQAFARMGCQGEVQIAEESDYAKWGIRIMVSFRDGDKMQPLTGQRQSGGERSLSTILYLMSLTELSKSPFSLVDEINQGMDQRAERAVHNQLVEVTCKDEAGQYFLITPKLLPNLRYHRLMKILCINNGEWLPEKVSLKQIVSSRRVKAA